MLDILQYGFMQRAIIAGIFIAIITPCIGVIIVLRRMSMLGDALSHSSLAGIAAGLIMGVDPVIGATVTSVVASLSIEKIRKSYSKYSEIAIAIVMSAGIGLVGILSGFVTDGADFTSFLFGSIVAVNNFDLTLIISLSVVVILSMLFLYRELFYITFDEEAARLSGIRVGIINIIFILITAITISISSRLVGMLMISSLLVIPTASALQVAKSYRQVFMYSILFAQISTIFGLLISYYLDLKPGGSTVLANVMILLLSLIYNKFSGKISGTSFHKGIA